jgi:hypothetical protein
MPGGEQALVSLIKQVTLLREEAIMFYQIE